MAAQKPETRAKKSAAKKSATKKTTAKKTVATDQSVRESINNESTAAAKSYWSVLIIIIIAAVFAGGYVWQQRELDAMQSRLDSLATQDASAKLSARLDANEDDFRAQLQTLREQTRDEILSLADSLAAAQRDASTDDSRLSLQEISRLLEFAERRLRLAGDADSAAVALQLADDKLRALDAPALATVRAQIAADIAAIEAMPTVDTVGTLSALSALADNVYNLPPVGDFGVTAVVDNPPSEQPTDDSSLWDAGKNILADLGDLVQIETDATPTTPILSAELRRVIVEKTALILASCQLAFLRGDGEIYRAQMVEAQVWVGDNFAADAPEVAAWLQRLSKLAAVDPQPSAPDISGSLRALRAAQNAAVDGTNPQ